MGGTLGIRARFSERRSNDLDRVSELVRAGTSRGRRSDGRASQGSVRRERYGSRREHFHRRHGWSNWSFERESRGGKSTSPRSIPKAFRKLWGNKHTFAPGAGTSIP